MNDLKASLSPVNGSGILRFMVGPVVGVVKVMGVGGTGIGCCTGCCGCLEVLILGWGPCHLGCSSLLLVSSSLTSVSYSLLLGAIVFLGSILTIAHARLSLGQAYSMIVGLSLLS